MVSDMPDDTHSHFADGGATNDQVRNTDCTAHLDRQRSCGLCRVLRSDRLLHGGHDVLCEPVGARQKLAKAGGSFGIPEAPGLVSA